MSIEINRIAIKIGSNVITRSNGSLNITQISALVDQVTYLYKKGIEIILISSGAIAAGRSELTTKNKLNSVDRRQLFSAIGQAKLINKYYELFREHGITVGQVLTTKDSFRTRSHYLSQKNCMTVMLENGVIPIVNENDTISVSELMFTDNDELSGLIASMMGVQTLIILSNVDGIYNGPPQLPTSQVIRTIDQTIDLSTYIQGSKSSFGRGGMLTKSSIAQKVADEGIKVIIANGNSQNILIRLLEEPKETVSTVFVPNDSPVSNVKKWIAHSEGFATGEIHLNQEATQILMSNQVASILPIGVIAIIGDFEKDDIVRIMSHKNELIGVGRVNYNAEKARSYMGKHQKKEMVHYDYLYIE
ncbi:MAG: glutamate 5-kinase [Bacteroidales bacterium]|nr:glutamate 5-kinase [Bacteroidales bacterium]